MQESVKTAKIRPDSDVADCPECDSLNFFLVKEGKRYSLFQYAMQNPTIKEVGVVCPTCNKFYTVPLTQYHTEMDSSLETHGKCFWGHVVKMYRQWDLSVLVDLVLVEENGDWKTLARWNVSHWHIHPLNALSIEFQWMESPHWKERKENELVLTLTSKAKWLGVLYQQDPNTGFMYLGISARNKQDPFYIV
jgi:hypothetical protein